jgi:hypothetical protein
VGGRLIADTPTTSMPSVTRLAPRSRAASSTPRRALGPVRHPITSRGTVYCAFPDLAPRIAGAFCCGLRVVSMEGSVPDVPDSGKNAAFFGRP